MCRSFLCGGTTTRRYVFVAALVLLACGGVVVGGTSALFSTETVNQASTLAGGWIGPATALGVTPSGYDAQLAWTPGTHGPVTGQQLYLEDSGSSSTCPASGYSLVANMASAGTSSYTAANPAATTLAANVGTTTLNVGPAGLNNSTTTINHVSASTSFPSVPFTVQIDSEQMTVTAEGGAGNNTWTVTRGVNGTTAAAHANGAEVDQVNVDVASASGFPGSGNYTIDVDSENMTVTSGQGTTSWLVSRGANGTTVAAHASGAVVTQVPDPVNGHYFCYEMVSTSASNWTGNATFPATQMGLVATGVSVANGRTQGVIDAGDTVTLTFNQQTSLAAGNTAVCLFSDASSNATIYLGDATCANAATDPYDAILTGSTFSQANTHKKVGATRAVASSAPWTVTYSVTQNNNLTLGNATWTLTPSTAVVSQNGGSDQAHACTSATYNCTPTAPQSGTAGF